LLRLIIVVKHSQHFPKYETELLNCLTFVYTHCVPVRTIKEAKSPLDF
jgi:hypothetical protein